LSKNQELILFIVKIIKLCAHVKEILHQDKFRQLSRL